MKLDGDKTQDFKVLKDASDVLLEKLRNDESVLDLKDQFAERMDAGNHKYYLDPYNNQWRNPMLKHSSFVPLPSGLIDYFRTVESASFMGLLPEINRAWISIDNKLFLWNISSPSDYTMYDGIADVIVSVALTTPKPNMFLKTVEYFLIVATTVEVLILALSFDNQYVEENRLKDGLLAANANVSVSSSVGVAIGSNKSKSRFMSELKVSPTKYIIPTDSVTIVKVLGTSCGRIFLAGVDGNMHEIVYDYVADTWINQLLGYAAAASDEPEDRHRGSYKCQKLTHSTSAFQLVNLLPDFIKGYAGYIDSMSDVVIDDVRHVMYGITVKGRLNVFYLGLDGRSISLSVSGFDVLEETIRFLRYGSREGMPTSDQLREGVRSGQIEIVGLHVIPLAESRQVHLMLVLSVGIRVYVSVRDQGNGLFCQNTANCRPPVSVEIVHVRNPPAAQLFNTLKTAPNPNSARSRGGSATNESMLFDRSPSSRSHGTPGAGGRSPAPRALMASPVSMHSRGVRDEGSSPRYAPHDALRLHTSFYGHGVFVSADGRDTEHDCLIGISEDLVARNTASQLAAISAADGSSSSSVTVSACQRPGMRESVGLIRPSGGNSASIGGKVYDIKEVCNDLYNDEASRLHTMVVSSRTPTAASITMKPVCAPISGTVSRSNRERNGNISDKDTLQAVPAPYMGPSTTVIPYVSREPYVGLTDSTASTACANMVSLSELVTEMSPSVCPVSTQRRLYCLTNKGLHVVAKSRPIDYLYELLISASGAASSSASDGAYLESLREFFQYYGSVESCAMCVSVACSTPFDVTGGSGGPLTNNSGLRTTVDVNIRHRIIAAMQRLSDMPCFQSISQSRTTVPSNSLFDNRIATYGAHSQTQPDKTFRPSAVHDGLQVFLSRTLRPIWLKPIVENNRLSSKFSPGIVKSIREALLSLLDLFKEYYSAVITAPIVDDRSGSVGGMLIAAGDREDEQMREHVLMMEARRLEETNLNRMCRLISRSIHALNTLEVISTALQSEDMKMINGSEIWSRFAQIDFYSFVCSPQCHAAVKDCVRKICDQTVLMYNGVSICDTFVERLSSSCYLFYSASDKLSYDAVKLLAKLEDLSQNDAEETKYYVDESVSLLLQQSLYWDNLEDVLGNASTAGSASANTNSNNLWYNCEKLRVYGSTVRLSSSLSCTPTAYYEKVVDAIVDMCLISCNHFYGCIIPNSMPHYTMSKLLKAATSAYFAGSSLDASGAVVIAAGAPYEEHEKAYYRGGAVDKLSDAQIISAKDSCYACLWHNIQCIKALPISMIGNGSVSSTAGASETNNQSLGVGSVRNELVKDPKLAYDLVLRMLSRVCSSTDDVMLHKYIYSQLYADNERELLVELDSNSFLDDFLRQVDPVLLYKNYEHHQRFSDAADLMVSLATDNAPAGNGEYGDDVGMTANANTSTEGSDIYQRMEYLSYAIHSGTVAVNNPTHDCSTSTAALTIELVSTMMDQLTVAKLQVLVYEALAGQLECILPTPTSAYTDAQMKEVDNLAVLVRSLKYELKTISELFCLATDPYKLFDLSLRIIHVAKNTETHLINKLWKSMLYRLVPEKAVTEIGQLFLETKRTAGDVIVDRRYQCRSVLFESEMQADGRGRSSDSWLHELQAKVLQMAQVLLREEGSTEPQGETTRFMGSNSVIFPVGLIMDECEELSTYLELACRQSASSGTTYAVKRGWVIDMLHEAGFSCGSLIETAVARLQKSDGRRVECTMRYIASVIHMLDKWIVMSSGVGQQQGGVQMQQQQSVLASMEQMELLQAIRAQSVRHWCDRLRHHIHVLSGHHMSAADKQLVDSYSNELKLIEHKVINLVIA